MNDARPPKRARQACEPCRSKKSKCPGEKPVCSYCHRLGQQCVYSGDGDALQSRHSRKMEYRMDNLEGKLDQLMQQLTPIVMASRRVESSCQAPTPSLDQITEEPWQGQEEARSGGDSDQPLDPVLLEVGQSYLTWCHNQPLKLFSQDGFLASLATRSKELLLALQALALRFPPGALTSQKQDSIKSIGKASRRLVMDHVADGHVKLSTLQTLVLLSLLDFADGKTIQAGLNLNMASHLVQSIPQGNSLGDVEECKNCMQAIETLQNIQGCIFTSPRQSSISAGSLPGTYASPVPGRTNLWTAPDGETAYEGLMDPGIIKCTFQISEVWRMAREYAANHVDPDAPPPWTAESDYSRLTFRHLEIDCGIPLRYRFSANRFDEYDLETLEKRRDYWGPYLFIQLVYAAIPCLLNHPFLLSMRLRNFRHTMPQAFIHQSFENITRHGGWIVYFIDLLEKKGFQVADPVLAHCVAVVATIHLQHSFVENGALRRKAQEGFEKCQRFLNSMGAIWPSVANMAENLRKLQRSVVGVPSPGREDGEQENAQQAFSIDSQLLWDILIYERAGRAGGTADQSMFGESETPTHETRTRNPREEFNLVGSAGISGHKSVLKEIPAYAPNDAATSPTVLGCTPNKSRRETELSVSAENRYFESVGGLGDQENWFLQADDFGRAIESWLNFDPVL